MEKFIPKEKLSKKARRQLDLGARSVWLISPVSRKSRDQKHYDRKKVRRSDIEGGLFYTVKARGVCQNMLTLPAISVRIIMCNCVLR